MSAQPIRNETHERSVYDDALHARALAYMQEHALSVSEFAEQIGYSRTTLSKYIRREYVTTASVEAALKAFFTREQRKGTGNKFSATAVSMAVLEACEYAYSEKALVVLFGPPQTGKSTGALEFVRRKLEDDNVRNLVFVTANSTTTPRWLVRCICKELGFYPGGCTAELLDRLVERMKARPHLIVIDDASCLTVKALESLRYLYDQAGVGIVLMGVRSLMERIFLAKGRMAEDLEQLYSRVDLQKYLPGSAERKDLESVARAHGVDDKTLELVLPHVQRPREMLKVCNRVKFLKRLNPDAAPDEIVQRALAEVFRAA